MTPTYLLTYLYGTVPVCKTRSVLTIMWNHLRILTEYVVSALKYRWLATTFNTHTPLRRSTCVTSFPLILRDWRGVKWVGQRSAPRSNVTCGLRFLADRWRRMTVAEAASRMSANLVRRSKHNIGSPGDTYLTHDIGHNSALIIWESDWIVTSDGRQVNCENEVRLMLGRPVGFVRITKQHERIWI